MMKNPMYYTENQKVIVVVKAFKASQGKNHFKKLKIK